VFLSDNNLVRVVDPAARRVIQVPQPAEGDGDIDRSGDVDVPIHVNRRSQLRPDLAVQIDIGGDQAFGSTKVPITTQIASNLQHRLIRLLMHPSAKTG
jgi:hypothetical protein